MEIRWRFPYRGAVEPEPDLLRQAYPRPMDLEEAWEDIAAAELGVDDVVLRARPGDEKLGSRLLGYRTASKEQRERLIQEVYYE